MKYEFHIGDYVETKGGAIGYVSNDEALWWRCTSKADGYEVGADYNIQAIETGTYNRIGQYDFTKPEQPKEIERMKEMEAENTWNGRSGGWLYAQQRKINELVDAVNELRKAK